ncbi:MAG: hypothetical protein AAGL98_05125, partial [Planctomycetota bacterium]
MSAVPAAGNITIEGVESDQVVTGEITLWAVVDAPRVQEISIHLIGPDGTEMTQRSHLEEVSLLAGEDGRPVAWDSTDYPEGQYTVAAYATVRSRMGRRVHATSVNFTVDHGGPVSQPTLVVNVPDVADETAGESNDAANPAAGDGALPVLTNNSSETVAVEVAAGRAADNSGANVRFAAGALTQRQIGDGRGVQIQARADESANADVLVIVWNDDARKIVSGFKRELPAEGTQLLAGRDLDQLPAGNLELQAHYRVDGRIRQTAKHKFINNPGATELPAIRFAAGVADAWTAGNAQAMAFDVAGVLPVDGDVLVLAWSIDQNQLVPGFAHVLTEAPFEISAGKLNTLPEGRVELQLRPRRDGVIEDKIVNAVTVNAVVNADLPEGDGDGEVAVGEDEQGRETPDNSGDGAQDNSSETPTAGDDSGDVSGGTAENDAGGEAVELPADVEISLASVPSVYTLNSGDTVAITVTGDLPAGADVLVLMWHNDRVEMVGGFAHELDRAPFAVSNARLD